MSCGAARRQRKTRISQTLPPTDTEEAERRTLLERPNRCTQSFFGEIQGIGAGKIVKKALKFLLAKRAFAARLAAKALAAGRPASEGERVA